MKLFFKRIVRGWIVGANRYAHMERMEEEARATRRAVDEQLRRDAFRDEYLARWRRETIRDDPPMTVS